MRKQDIDPRVIKFLKETNQYELFNKASGAHLKSLIDQATAWINDNGGDVDKSVSEIKKVRDQISANLFPKKS